MEYMDGRLRVKRVNRDMVIWRHTDVRWLQSETTGEMSTSAEQSIVSLALV